MSRSFYERLFFLVCKYTRSGVAINGEEYVPVIVPIRSAAAKNLIVSPPNNTRGISINTIVNELLMERTIVSVNALFALVGNGSVVVF